MFSGFQSNAFQNNAFQIISGIAEQQTSGGVPKEKYRAQSYELGKHEWQKLQREKREAERALKAKEREIERIEDQRTEDLANELLQAQLLRLFREAHELELEKQRLINLLLIYQQEDEDVLCLLLSLPFIN